MSLEKRFPFATRLIEFSATPAIAIFLLYLVITNPEHNKCFKLSSGVVLGFIIIALVSFLIHNYDEWLVRIVSPACIVAAISAVFTTIGTTAGLIGILLVVLLYSLALLVMPDVRVLIREQIKAFFNRLFGVNKSKT